MACFKTVRQVVDWRLCLGCGVCAYICPDRKVRLVDYLEEGIRPVVETDQCGSCRLCLEVCPSYENDHRTINAAPGLIEEVKPFCGPVLEIWEGHAVDSQVRLAGSSGGLITALSLYCLEEEKMHGVLHIGQDPTDPLRNKTTMSQTRAELMGKTGSRYAPASACDSLHLIENAPQACVFVGQPTEVTALQKARALKPGLDRNVGVTISFFCAGSPSRKGTEELLKSMGVDREQVQDLRYRGNGWPGLFAVTMKGQSTPSHFRTYKESWGFVQAYRPFSVHLCPDGTGEDADISCGDPWYREVKPGEPGSSLVVVRTQRGKRIVQGAIAAGYVELQPAEPWKLLRSQEGLFEKRGAIWGRIAMLRAFGLPAPKLRGFSLFKNWLRLSLEDKLRSTVGTARRIVKRKYSKPLRLVSPKEGMGTIEALGAGDGEVRETCDASECGKSLKSNGVTIMTNTPSVLVAIASHGTAQDHHLRRVVSEYRNSGLPVKLVVLSNQPKVVEGTEVVVGLPSSNPYSLPFAHRKLMADRADEYDLFIYSEDDVLITRRHIESFLHAQSRLKEGEIAGLIRSEKSPEGRSYITSIHHHFRWRPESVVERDGELFAELSNLHSGCFIATRNQLKQAIASGGFLVAPHAERYGMLETAASDLYSQCGLRRLLSISRIEDFIVAHLPNKYYSKMGIPLEALQQQINTLREIFHDGRWSGALFQPESRMPGFGWSCDLHAPADEALVEGIPANAATVLCVGSGWGGNEDWLIRKGFGVWAVPIDGVFGATLRQRGIKTVEGPLDVAVAKLDGQRFDAVLIQDALHLVESPSAWLQQLHGVLAPGGVLRMSVPNTLDLPVWMKDWHEGKRRSRIIDFESAGAHAVTPRRLRQWCRAAGLEPVAIRPMVEGRRRNLSKLGFGMFDAALASRFLVTARSIE